MLLMAPWNPPFPPPFSPSTSTPTTNPTSTPTSPLQVAALWRPVFIVELLVAAVVVPAQFASLAVITLPFTLPLIVELQAAGPAAALEGALLVPLQLKCVALIVGRAAVTAAVSLDGARRCVRCQQRPSIRLSCLAGVRGTAAMARSRALLRGLRWQLAVPFVGLVVAGRLLEGAKAALLSNLPPRWAGESEQLMHNNVREVWDGMAGAAAAEGTAGLWVHCGTAVTPFQAAATMRLRAGTCRRCCPAPSHHHHPPTPSQPPTSPHTHNTPTPSSTIPLQLLPRAGGAAAAGASGRHPAVHSVSQVRAAILVCRCISLRWAVCSRSKST